MEQGPCYFPHGHFLSVGIDEDGLQELAGAPGVLALPHQVSWGVVGSTARCSPDSDSSSSLQGELVGKLVDDGGGTTYLSLHLPVAQRLVLVGLVAETDELALQVNFVHCDAAAGGGVLTNASLGHSASHHAGGLTVIVVQAALLGAARAGGVAAAGGSGSGMDQAAGVAVA